MAITKAVLFLAAQAKLGSFVYNDTVWQQQVQPAVVKSAHCVTEYAIAFAFIFMQKSWLK
jgi:hypothetical protein